MVALPLTSGAYSAANLIANAQRCVNLFPEANPPETRPPVPVTHLLSPGLRFKLTFPDMDVVRGLYRSTNGVLYAVCGASVYTINQHLVPTKLGTIAYGTNQVKMADNGLNMLIVDGTSSGYVVDLANNIMGGLDATNNSGLNGFVYYGANYVDCVDQYLIGNAPNTPSWWASSNGGLLFDPLSFATKSGKQDRIKGLVVLRRYVWLIGALATEIWYNAGGTNFPFAILSGPYIEHGTTAQYSICKSDESVLWLSQDINGQNIVLLGDGYAAQRVSTYAIEKEFSTYSTTQDAIGFAFQQAGHSFYCLRFPTADKTWIYDKSTGQWHERITQDAQGLEHQWRVTCTAFAYGMNFGGDFENGNLYQITPDELTDNFTPIKRLRSWPHVVSELKRIVHWRFIADMDVGNLPENNSIPIIDRITDPASGLVYRLVDDTGQQRIVDPPGSNTIEVVPPTVLLRWSDTRGKSWGNAVPRDFGLVGQLNRNVLWPQTGIARDRVWELSWSAPQLTALNGAFEQPVPAVS